MRSGGSAWEDNQFRFHLFTPFQGSGQQHAARTCVEEQAQRPGHDQAQQQRRRERTRIGGCPVAVQRRFCQMTLERKHPLRDHACARQCRRGRAIRPHKQLQLVIWQRGHCRSSKQRHTRGSHADKQKLPGCCFAFDIPKPASVAPF